MKKNLLATSTYILILYIKNVGENVTIMLLLVMDCFCGIDNWWTASILNSGRDNCLTFSPLEPFGFVEWRCALMTTTMLGCKIRIIFGIVKYNKN